MTMSHIFQIFDDPQWRSHNIFHSGASISKIIESLLFDIVETTDEIDDYQFGFHKGVSTAMCTDVFKVQSIIIAGMAAMSFAVLSISKKLLIELIIGYYSVSF